VVALSGDTTSSSDRGVGGGRSQPAYIHVLVNNAYLGLIRQSQARNSTWTTASRCPFGQRQRQEVKATAWHQSRWPRDLLQGAGG